MRKAIKRLFEHRCPVCKTKLEVISDAGCYTKSCSQGHYKEEHYCALGVTIVYDGLQ